MLAECRLKPLTENSNHKHSTASPRFRAAVANARCESHSERLAGSQRVSRRLALLLPAIPAPVTFSSAASATQEAAAVWRDVEFNVTLAQGVEAPGGDSGALYLTIRNPGRSPVVAVKRVPYPITFPLRTTVRRDTIRCVHAVCSRSHDASSWSAPDVSFVLSRR